MSAVAEVRWAPVPIHAVQGSLALDLGTEPSPAPRPMTPETSALRGADTVVVSPAARRELQQWALTFGQACVEVVLGDRPVTQLALDHAVDPPRAGLPRPRGRPGHPAPGRRAWSASSGGAPPGAPGARLLRRRGGRRSRPHRAARRPPPSNRSPPRGDQRSVAVHRPRVRLNRSQARPDLKGPGTVTDRGL